MKRIFALAAALAFSGTMVAAAITPDDVIKTYQDAGYTRIEVTRGRTQIKVEAIKEGQQIEVVYDAETGNVIKTESGVADHSDDRTPGVKVKTRDRDFVKDGRVGDDSTDGVDDDSSDDGMTGDDGLGDDHGSDGVDDDSTDDSDDSTGSDDDSSDVDGSDGDDSSDDDGRDDHGGDDDSSDDRDDDHGSDDRDDDHGDDD